MNFSSFPKRSAIWVAQSLGTVPMFWGCALLVCIGASLPVTVPVIMFISQTVIQLLALPALGIVGNENDRRNEERYRASELRAQQDHEAIISELAEIKEMHTILVSMHGELHVHLGIKEAPMSKT